MRADEVESEMRWMSRRWWIEPLPVADWPEGERRPLLIPVTTESRQEIAERIGGYFHAESGFDFSPYSAGDESEDRLVFLVNSREMHAMMPIAVGAVELQCVEKEWVLTWVWLHPFERSNHHRTFNQVWSELENRFGQVYLLHPLSRAMKGFARRIGIPNDRIVTIA